MKIKGNLDMNHLGTTCVGGASAETLRWCRGLMRLGANVGSKTHTSLGAARLHHRPGASSGNQVTLARPYPTGGSVPFFFFSFFLSLFFLQEIRAHVPTLLDSQGHSENQITSIMDSSFIHSAIICPGELWVRRAG